MGPRLSRYYTYIKPVLKNRLVKTYSSLVFSLITITIFTVYAIRPTISTIISLQKSVSEQQGILDKLNEKTRNLTNGRENYTKLDDEVKLRLVTLLPDSTTLPPLINDITSIAIINSASISGIQFQPVDLIGPPTLPVKNAALKEIDFTVNYQAPYPQLIKILETLTRANRLISIQSANFNKPTDDILILSLTGKTYYFSNK